HPIDLPEFVDEIATRAAALGDRELVVEPAEPIVFRADAQRLHQAVMNLVRNAFEHTPDEAKVTFSARTTGDQLKLSVSDTGPGIPESEQAVIFERFTRGQVGRRTTTGAGLGLPIVAAIARSHGGELEVDSSPEGTTFTITIPMEE
ncbi:MAG TPA: ATP-binding protein, partial [Acidimicrobiia bacterium]|nr:ATP-binding protein [Acidimicrobiia bacterium]